MTLLVDTNAFLFALLAPGRLSPTARDILENRENGLVWSVASTWEVVVKARLGKLDLGGDVEPVLTQHLVRLGMRVLPVEQAHAMRVATLPEVERHADPFDRILIAQALVEGLPVLTADPRFERYPVQRIW